MERYLFSEPYVTDFAATGGCVSEEATAFVEFCVELDSQDDRNAPPGDPRYNDPKYSPRIDSSMWEVAYDSRAAVARDYMSYKVQKNIATKLQAPLTDDDLVHWAKLFAKIEDTAAKRRIVIHSNQDILDNPDLNGFSPWQNAWILYRGVGNNTDKYAIAIRGTVFSNTPSAIEDAIFQPVIGREFLSQALSFSRNENASLHGGFAHATFTLLLDKRYGILPILKMQRVAPNSALYIIGHSQGAAMATLVHAFLFNTMYQAETSTNDPFDLRNARYRLKSYCFAQPKPGNYSFSAEFARYTQGPDTAIVINNHIDPVPKVPLTYQSTADLETDFYGRFLLSRILRASGAFGKWIRRITAALLDYFTRKSAEGYGYFYRYDVIKPLAKSGQVGSSWNFVPAGRVILVYGTPQPNQGSDIFFQHHSTTYRDLIKSQLASQQCAGNLFATHC